MSVFSKQDQKLHLETRRQTFRELQARHQSEKRSRHRRPSIPFTPLQSFQSPPQSDTATKDPISAQERWSEAPAELSNPEPEPISMPLASSPHFTKEAGTLSPTRPVEPKRAEASTGASPAPRPPAPAPELPVTTELSAPLPPSLLAHHVNSYTLARFEEATVGKNPALVGKSAARAFKSALRYCPCGTPLPCPAHGDYPDIFWELNSDHPDYKFILESKNLPYTSPYQLLRDHERQARFAQAINDSPEAAVVDEQKAQAHARARHLAYTPRPPGTPPPDDSWTRQCPCGTDLPCPLHDDLWREVRYLHPSHPDYIAALESRGLTAWPPVPPPDPAPNQELSEPLALPQSSGAFPPQ